MTMNSLQDLRLEAVLTPPQQQAYTEIHNALNPRQPENWEGISRWDGALSDGDFFGRWLAHDEGELLGACSMMNSHWTGPPDECAFGVRPVLGADAEAGAARMIRHLEGLAKDKGWKVARSYVPSHQEDVVAAFENAGYRVAQENPETELDLTAFRVKDWTDRIGQVRMQGVAIKSADELEKSVPDFLERFWRMEDEIFKDVPEPGGYQPRSLESFAKELEVWRPHFSTCLIALSGEEWIGTSQLEPNSADPRRYATGLTGVLRPWRRKGVATALKAACLQRAKDAGGIAVTTDNEKNNPMLDLNKALGFQMIYVTRSYERRLDC